MPDKNAWRDIEIKTTRNLPKNILEEAQTAAQLEGMVSRETQLSVLSIISNVADEIEKIESEQQEKEETIVDKRMFGAEIEK